MFIEFWWDSAAALIALYFSRRVTEYKVVEKVGDNGGWVFSAKILCLSTTHLVGLSPHKHILPISLKEGDENSQPGEQPDDTLMWAESTKPKLFGHLLAQQVACNYSIDPADGVEPVPNPGPDVNFSGNVIIEAKKKALEESKKYRAGNIFWVDGSKPSQGNAGAATCWKDKNLNKLENKSAFLGKNKEIIDAELWAILIGLETSGKITLDTHQTPITSFSDSREALNSLCQLSPITRTL